MIESEKDCMGGSRQILCDPEFAKIPLAGLLSKEYAGERRKLIDSQARGEG